MRAPCLSLALVCAACTLPTSGNGPSEGSGGSTASVGVAVGGMTGSGGQFTTSTTVSTGASTSTGPSGGTGPGGASGCGTGFVCAPMTQGTLVRAISGGTCPAAWPTAAAYAGNAMDPGCTDCTCGMPSGGSCVPAHLVAHDPNNCGVGLAAGYDPALGACTNVTQGGIDSISTSPPTAMNGSCEASTSMPKPLNQPQTLCSGETPSGTCVGGVCVADDPSPLCVLLPGQVACPAGWGMAKHVYAAMDARTCTCSCGSSKGSCDGVSLSLFDAADCGGTSATVPPNGCHDPPNINNILSFRVDATWNGSACAPMLDAGAVTFGAAQTLCCM